MVEVRNTEQRKKILEYLKSVHTHPSAEIVYKAIKKDLPKITLATVYRNLNLLAEQGEIQRLEINKEYRYDACCNAHQHCVCEECGAVMETFQEEINNYALKKFKGKNFKPREVNIMFKGCCNSCDCDKECDCGSEDCKCK
ncbi:MAG: transcriptional repressor [archaeon]